MSATIRAALSPYKHLIKEIRHCPQGAGCIQNGERLCRVYWLVTVSGWVSVDRIQNHLRRKGVYALVQGGII